jgi:putative addiction module CopG family antidote
MTVHIPQDLARFVEEAVASGRFTSEEDVVRDALTRLQQSIAETAAATAQIGTPTPNERPLTKEALKRHLTSIGLVDAPAGSSTDGNTAGERSTEEDEIISEIVIRERLIEWLTGFLSKN